MRRGDFVTVALPADFGKPRPDLFGDTATVTLLLVTTSIVDLPLLRVTAEPDEDNGLRVRSQIQFDKVMTTFRTKVGAPFGRINAELLLEVDRRLALFVGIVS